MAAKRKKRVGRPELGEAKRDKRVVSMLTAAEYDALVARAEEKQIPLFLYVRWLLNERPIPK